MITQTLLLSSRDPGVAVGTVRGPVNPFESRFPAAPRATCREAPHRPELHRSALAVRRALSAAPARSLRTSRQRVSQRVEHLANLQQGAANGARPVLETSPLNIGARKQRSHVDHAHWLRRSGRADGPESGRMASERCRRVRLTGAAPRTTRGGNEKRSSSKTWEPGGRSSRARSRHVGRVQRGTASAQRASSRCRASSRTTIIWRAASIPRNARIGVPETDALLRGRVHAGSRAASVLAQRLQPALYQLLLGSRRRHAKWRSRAFYGGSRGGSRTASPACLADARMRLDPLAGMCGWCLRVAAGDLRLHGGRALHARQARVATQRVCSWTGAGRPRGETDHGTTHYLRAVTADVLAWLGAAF